MHQLAIGSAQFGLAYGIANRNGKTALREVGRILGVARSAGVDTIDTAVAYGDSETALGDIGLQGWHVVSKIPAIPPGQADVAEWVLRSVRSSLKRLRTDKLAGLLLHRPGDLVGAAGEELLCGLMRVKAEGLAEKIGVSVYGPDEIVSAKKWFLPDLVQIPFNPVDQRAVRSGAISELCREGVEVHIRSVFLQGLLLMPAGTRPVFFDRWSGIWELWNRWLSENSLTPLQVCLRFALQQHGISRVVIGVESAEQLEEVLAAADGVLPVLPEEVQCSEDELVNPSLWQKT